MKKVYAIVISMLIFFPQMIAAEEGTMTAVITRIEGKLMIAPRDSGKWLYAKEGDFLYEGDTLKTDDTSMAILTFVNGIEVKLNKGTKFAINMTEISEKGRGNAVNVSVGQVWSRILKEGTAFDIETPAATVAIRGSEGDTKVASNGRTRFILYYGKAYVENEFGKVTMKPGTKTAITVGSAPEEPLPAGETDKEKWQDAIAGNPKLKLVAEKPESIVGFPVKLTVTALDGTGAVDTSAEPTVRISAGNDACTFSDSSQGKDRKTTMTLKLTRGTKTLWVFPVVDGSMVITAQSGGFETGMARIIGFQPSKKNLEMDIEMEDGKQKTLKLRFRR